MFQFVTRDPRATHTPRPPLIWHAAWVPGSLALATFVLPALHPLARPIVGVPSHLMWFAHAFTVAVLAHRRGIWGGLGALLVSAATVALGEMLFGEGYGHPADTMTVVSLTVAVTLLNALVMAFALGVRQAEERRRELSVIAMAALEAAPEGILVLDPARRVVLANASASVILGEAPDDLRHRHVDELLDTAEWTPDGGVVLRRPDGSVFPANWVATPIGDDDLPDGWLVSLRDLTDNVRIDEDHRRTRALVEMGQLIAGIAHELNNPLTGVLGYAELLGWRDDLAGEAREHLDALVHETRRAAGIARRLLRVVRHKPPSREHVDAVSVVRTAIRLRLSTLAAHRIAVRDEMLAELPPVSADPGELEQVMVNLINNAQHAMTDAHDGGTLVVRARQVRDRIEFEVADDGPGVPSSVADRIFDPFLSTKGPERGTGLGLPIARRIARAHGGDLRFHPNAPTGAVFVLCLPVASTKEAQPTAPAPRHTPTSTVRRALVIDDEPAIRDTLRRILERSGFTADCASNAHDAREQLANGSYSVILCDMRLGADSGSDLYEEVIAERNDLRGRFLFVTGDVLSDEIERFLVGSRERYLAKPFQVDELLRQIDEVAA